MQPTPETVAASPEWHLQRLDAEQERALLVQVSEELLRRASFLDQRIEPEVEIGWWTPWAQAEALFAEAPADDRHPALIFHVGHCGSTLLSRALANDPAVLPLREPLPLRDLSNAQRGGPLPGSRKDVRDVVMRALARTFRTGQVPVVKATSICTNLAQPLLEGSSRRAVLMLQPLESQLANVLGKQGPTSDLEGFRAERLHDWQEIAGTPPPGLDLDNDSHLAVLHWLTGVHALLAARAAFPDRTLLLDFEDLLESPAEWLGHAAALLAPHADPRRMAAAWADTAREYSKQPGTPFHAVHRAARLERGRTAHAAELAEGMALADSLVDAVPALAPCRAHFRKT
ncbi:MAG: hypothetical protein R3233_11120 [Xanthomonadales bacterium]|nr:hypothetical protein [Xanthomonadales bacterium]